MKIVVLCGGTSSERDVSITSGRLICNSLIKNGHEVILLDVFLGIDKVTENIFDMGEAGLKQVVTVGNVAPDIEKIKSLREDANVFFGPNVIEICKKADIVFMALHGENGENGKVQAAFDLLGIKYTGSGYMGSLLAMNKDLTRKVLIANGINMAEGLAITREDRLEDYKSKLFLPAVVKPASGGSSVGVSIVSSGEDLEAAIQEALKYDECVVIEKYIAGREFSVGVIDGTALPIIEIIPKTGFYDYKNKYQAGLTEEICPANLSAEDTLKIKTSAQNVYKALGLQVYARIDYILSHDGELVCLEANTLPGMTPTSLLPQEASQIGLSHEELCEKIIELSLRKKE